MTLGLSRDKIALSPMAAEIYETATSNPFPPVIGAFRGDTVL